MENDTYSQAYRLFRAALDEPEGARHGFIATNGCSSSEITTAFQMLRDFELGTDPELGAAVVLPERARDRQGSIVNDWHVGPHIELGGFGSVYQAWRPIGAVKEEAAIKFLDVALDQVPRFLQERQVLADLNHEGICKFIDGGTTEGGVPYVVMEYVAGLPITRYCDYHRITVTGRLKLFVKLCQAVEYAHQHRVLHRDLKPPNVFVTAAGAVRVLDFGVAKLLGDGCADHLTKPGDTPWTRAYASPEQVKGAALSFATDIYSLGALLYELVTGELPFSESALVGADWRQAIEEREPLPPSQSLLIGTPAEAGCAAHHPPETAAHLRGASPSRLKRILAGNLDAVILKALRRDPQQRYQRVDRLRLDIERFLEGLPVTVRKSSLWERARNWSAKHPVSASVIAVSTLWIALVFNVLLVRDTQYRASLVEEGNAVAQLKYLAESGLHSIESSLPREPKAMKPRVLAAQIHTKFLDRLRSLPDYILMGLDSSMGTSALQCGREWEGVESPKAALTVSSWVLPRIARRYELEDRDRQWREIYVQLLRQRIQMHTLLGQQGELTDESRRLGEIEARHR